MTKQELLKFICEMYNMPHCSEVILKQINKYVTERGYKYLDIARALSYFVDIQGNEPQTRYGIAIVPFVMEESKKYFAELKKQKEEQIKAAKETKQKNGKDIYCILKKENTIKRKSINLDNI